MFALSLGSALPTNYATLGGLVWLAILVSLGIRSNMAALVAGLSATLLAGIALVYLPTAFGQVTPILFGVGAIQVAKYPNGVMTENARRTLSIWDKVRKRPRPMWTSELDQSSAGLPTADQKVLVGAEAAETTAVGKVS